MSQRCCCFSNTTIPFDASSIFSNSTFSPKGAITFPAHEYVWLKVKDCSAKPISARRARFVPHYSGLPESFKNERHAYKNSNVNFDHCWSCFQSSDSFLREGKFPKLRHFRNILRFSVYKTRASNSTQKI